MLFLSKISAVWQYMNKSTKENEIFFVPFGFLLVIGYLGFYYFNLLIAIPQGYESFIMRLLVSLLGLGLIFKQFTEKLFKGLMPIFWYFTLVYSLPFFFFYMLFQNPYSNIWQINGLVGMVTLTFFVDWLVYIIITAFGIICAYLCFFITNETHVLPLTLLGVFGSYSAPVVYLVLFSYKRKQLYSDKLLAGEKAFNAKLLEKSINLKKALSIKSEFLNNISHEVRTPISGVVNVSELLVENWDKYSQDVRFDSVKLIARSGKRLLLLMNNILDLSKFESGKIAINMKQANLEKLVTDMVIECKELYLGGSKVQLETYIQPHLNSDLKMDPNRITQVLRNIMGNAIKFTSSGIITVTLQKQGNNLEVIVKDEGIGIPEDELEQIFSPFIQSSKTRNKAGGTGLGLAICKEIIEAHGGKIWALNNQTKGISLHFLLPKLDGLITKEAQIKNTKRKILVIDDDNTCHGILNLILKAENYDMDSVYGGLEGLKYLKNIENKDSINAVLLDLMMPDMYGLNVLREIKSNPELSSMPVIIQTASHDQRERDKAIKMGALGFIRKPYNREELKAVLNEAFKDA